jgi:hypothetical protein
MSACCLLDAVTSAIIQYTELNRWLFIRHELRPSQLYFIMYELEKYHRLDLMVHYNFRLTLIVWRPVALIPQHKF